MCPARRRTSSLPANNRRSGGSGSGRTCEKAAPLACSRNDVTSCATRTPSPPRGFSGSAPARLINRSVPLYLGLAASSGPTSSGASGDRRPEKRRCQGLGVISSPVQNLVAGGFFRSAFATENGRMQIRRAKPPGPSERPRRTSACPCEGRPRRYSAQV